MECFPNIRAFLNSEFYHQSQIQRTVHAEVLRLTEIRALSAVQAGLVRNPTPRRRPLHDGDEGADGLMKRCSETGASLLHLLLPPSIPPLHHPLYQSAGRAAGLESILCLRRWMRTRTGPLRVETPLQ